MNQNSNPGPLRKRDGEPSQPISYEEVTPANGARTHGFAANGHASPRHISYWVILDVVLGRWYWLALGSLACAGLFLALGWQVVKPKFIASAQLQRFEPPGLSDSFKTSPLSGETFAALMRSPELLRDVALQANPPISPERLAKCIRVDPEPDSDIVQVLLAAPFAQQAVDLLNLYAHAAVEFSTELQKNQAAKLANDYLKQQVTQMDQDIAVLRQQFRGLPVSPQVTNKLSEIDGELTALGQNLAASRPSAIIVTKLSERLTTALGELTTLTSKYTTNYPSVKQLESEIKDLESRIAQASSNVPRTAPVFANNPASRPATSGVDPEVDIIRMKLLSLEQGRVQLATRLREAEAYAKTPPGNVRLLAPATLNSVKTNMRSLKLILLAVFGGVVGLCGTTVLALLSEFTDGRLKSPEDLKYVTKLPVLTGLGDLNEMGPEERSQWAFRTWTLLQGRLSPTANHGLVCGFTSSAPGEGRSTWISLLAEAASLTGFRVLTISTRPSPMQLDVPDESTDALADPIPHINGNGSDAHLAPVVPNILAAPDEVAAQLTGPNSQPVVHIPLPGWVWNLERRREWREALNHWRTIDNLVILVELPPANVTEAVLLGCNLPNLIWLAESGTADAAETRAQLETLRDARCNLVGAVVNRQDSPSIKSRFPRWLE